MTLYRTFLSLVCAASLLFGCTGCEDPINISTDPEGQEEQEEHGGNTSGDDIDPKPDPEPVVEHSASLAYSEFAENASKYVAGYDSPSSFTNESGAWTVCAYNTSTAMQINKDKVAYVGTPLFDGIVTKVELSLSDTYSGNILLCGVPGTKTADDVRVTAVCKTQRDVTIDASKAGLKQLYIRSSACARIVSVSITYVTGGSPDGPGPVITDDDDDDDDTGGEGDKQEDVPGYGVGFSKLYEVPAVTTALLEGQAYSNTVDEKFGDSKAFICNMPSEGQRLVTHTYKYNNKMYRTYTMLFDKGTASAVWEAYVLHKTAYPDKGVGRSGNWVYDPAIPESWQTAGCEGSYHKGHQVPSNDRQTCTGANKQTFYYSNQTPQWQTRFNDGIWNTLEQRVNGAAPTGSDTLYVVTGPLYENSATITDETGKTVPLPSGYFKCLMKCSFGSDGAITGAKGCGYIFPRNEAYSGSNYGTYGTTIDEVEKLTGFDFFANIPASLQNPAEAKIMFTL